MCDTFMEDKVLNVDSGITEKGQQTKSKFRVFISVQLSFSLLCNGMYEPTTR